VAEGPDAARRFAQTMNTVLRVSKDELAKREAEYQEGRRTTKLRTPRPATTK
jgi:hypothetical protein